MQLIFLNTIEYPYMKPLRPDAVDFYNLSVTASYINYTSKINGSYTALNLNTTKPGQSTVILLQIVDKSWNYTHYERTINTDNPPQNLIRNISFLYAIYDGLYTQFPTNVYICQGLYFPNVSRGAADCLHYSNSATNNTLDLKQITKQALDLNQQWPNQQQTDIIDFQQKYNDGEKGLLEAKNKPSVVFFTLSRTIRNKSQLTTFPPDIQIRHQWKKQGYLKNQVEYVPHIDATIIGQDAGYTIQINSQIQNIAFQQKQALIFFSINVVIQSIFIFCNLKFLTQIDTYVHLQRLNIVSMVMVFTTQFFQILLYLPSMDQFVQLTNVAILVFSINAIILLSLVISILLILAPNILIKYGNFKGTLITLFWFIISVIPILIIITMQRFEQLPIIATQVSAIIIFSFLIIYSIFIAIKNQQPKYPILYAFIYTIDKIVILSYVIAIKNHQYIGYNKKWCIIIASIFLIQLFIYVLQCKFGPRLCFIIKKRKSNNFINNSLNILIIQKLQGSNSKYNDKDIVLSYKDDNLSKNNICANYSHTHSELYDKKNRYFLLNLQQLKFMQQNEVPDVSSISDETNCYCYVKQSNIEEVLCSLCFDCIDVVNANDKQFQRIFNDKNKLLSTQEIQYLKCYSQLKKVVWITPCGHCFHAECLQKWMIEKQYCPICQHELNI